MLHGLVLGEALANGHERLGLIAHQMGVGFDLCFNRTFGRAMKDRSRPRHVRHLPEHRAVTSVGRCTIAMTGAFSVFA
jgi:hypothetical protein